MDTMKSNELEAAILRLLPSEGSDPDFVVIVERLRPMADDASIKAAVLRLNAEGTIQITPDWKLHVAQTSVAQAPGTRY